ncbi:hypothetical protein LJB86_04925 [Deltaproteobacteria bacterium OttesenSCG-928-M10]|nr:hypothetical protein [Deltaproteobacteria bacterium OttesenSCG-928-M10]
MQRIDGPGAVAALPALSPPANSPGFFSGGDPVRGREATMVTKDWLNWVQEEICTVIEEAGITLDRADHTQLWQALQVLFGLSPDPGGGGGGGKPIEPGDFELFYRQTPPIGWAVANGGLLVGADTAAPKLWAELQKSEKAWLLKTQAQWDALSQAAPFSGIGGAPFFVLDLNAKTLRLPDMRGMYLEPAGFNGLTVGGTHGDAIRNITGEHFYGQDGDTYSPIRPTGALSYGPMTSDSNRLSWIQAVANAWYPLILDVSRVVPTASVNQPKAFGLLPCVYTGGPDNA